MQKWTILLGILLSISVAHAGNMTGAELGAIWGQGLFNTAVLVFCIWLGLWLVPKRPMSTTKKYALRASFVVFFFQMGQALIGNGPGNSQGGESLGVVLVTGFFLALLLAGLAAVVGAAFGFVVDHMRESPADTPKANPPASTPSAIASASRITAAPTPVANPSVESRHAASWGAEHVSPLPLATPHGFNEEIPDAMWAIALTELDGPDRRSGLWAKCYARTSGVEAATRAEYLALRSKELFADAQAIAKALAAEQAAQVAHAARLDSVTPEQRSIYEDLEHFKLNGVLGMSALSRLILALGGNEEWKSKGVFSTPKWYVTIAGASYIFPTDDALCTWGLAELPSLVQNLLPPVLQEAAGVYRSLGKCPLCKAKVALSATQCLSCSASFDEYSTWKPLPSSAI